MWAQCLALLTVPFRYNTRKMLSQIFLHILLYSLMSSFKQKQAFMTFDTLKQNQRLHKEILQIKQELFQVYQQNIKLQQIVKQFQRQKQFYGECQQQISRLKVLMKSVDEKKSSVPTQRQEIKDRIIMKLQDELITTKIQLKQTQLELSRCIIKQ